MLGVNTRLAGSAAPAYAFGAAASELSLYESTGEIKGNIRVKGIKNYQVRPSSV